MFAVSYMREDDTNLYRVRCHVINQTIVVDRKFLVKVGMNPRCIIGCQELTIHEIIELGFVFPSAINRMVI